MHEIEDEPLFAERAAGIDIAKAGIEVTLRVPSDTRAGRRASRRPGLSPPPAGNCCRWRTGCGPGA
jgi:hypothetical protein